MIEAGFAVAVDGEVHICIEHETRPWTTLGVVLIREATLSLASDTDILLEDQPIPKSLATRLVSQGRVSVISAGDNGVLVANECKVMEPS
jgi:hypothetical protein